MEQLAEEKIVDAIIRDLSDRRGLAQEWGQLDSATKDGIRSKWLGLAREQLIKPEEIEAPPSVQQSGYYWAVYLDEDQEVCVGVIRCIHQDWMWENPQGPMISANPEESIELLGPRMDDWKPPEGLVEEIERRLTDEEEED